MSHLRTRTLEHSAVFSAEQALLRGCVVMAQFKVLSNDGMTLFFSTVLKKTLIEQEHQYSMSSTTCTSAQLCWCHLIQTL